MRNSQSSDLPEIEKPLPVHCSESETFAQGQPKPQAPDLTPESLNGLRIVASPYDSEFNAFIEPFDEGL